MMNRRANLLPADPRARQAVLDTANSRIRYARLMGLKEGTVRGVGFSSLAIFRPGTIAGNAHTPRMAGAFHPRSIGTIGQDDLAGAFVAHSRADQWLARLWISTMRRCDALRATQSRAGESGRALPARERLARNLGLSLATASAEALWQDGPHRQSRWPVH